MSRGAGFPEAACGAGRETSQRQGGGEQGARPGVSCGRPCPGAELAPSAGQAGCATWEEVAATACASSRCRAVCGSLRRFSPRLTWHCPQPLPSRPGPQLTSRLRAQPQPWPAEPSSSLPAARAALHPRPAQPCPAAPRLTCGGGRPLLVAGALRRPPPDPPVIQRIFYTVNRSWTGRITCTELRRSTFLQNVALLEEEADINQLTEYFSYEHFYVIYCKFWELDTDHDLLIDAQDLARHNDH
ncbi:Hypothetical predicted protein, partial [Marmota monax]